MPERGASDTFGARLAEALAGPPPGAPTREVWSVLGAAGLTAEVYDRRAAAWQVRPGRLAACLAALDARGATGVTLGCCVQLATVVPLLAAGAEGGGGSGPVAGAAAATLAGRQVTALAVTDAGSGSDLTALDTTVRLGDELVLTGAKRWITNAVGADAYLVLARHRPGRHFTSFSLVLVPATAPGVRATPADTPLFAGGGVGHVELAGVRLPRDHLVGAPGRGLAAFARHLATERLAGALWGVALCRRAITATRDRMAARAYGDGALWDLDPVRATLADCVVRTRQLDALCRALEERVARTWDAAGAALLKAAAADVAERVLTACAHLHGADGFAASGLHQLRAEAAVLGTGGGATEVALGLVADDLDRALADLDRPGPDPADRDRADPDRADPAGVPR